MTLSKYDVSHIARLAHLKFTDEELSRYGSQLTSILDYIGQIQQASASNIAPTHTVSGAMNVARADEITCIPEETAREKLLSQSAMRDGDFLKVPGVFETNNESGIMNP